MCIVYIKWIQRCLSFFLSETSVSDFLGRILILKSDVIHGIVTVEPCQPIDTVCMGQSSFERPFFYMYLFVF